MTELECLLTLNAIPGLGNIRTRRLIERFGSAGKVLALNSRDIIREGIVPTLVAEGINHFSKNVSLKKEYELVKKHDVKIISYQDKEYPENLREIPDAPVILYVKGRLIKEDNLAVAVVGSRRASLYGLAVAAKIAMGLAEVGITVISGMARGIDSAAHKGALKAKGRTIAVFGCGLTHIYPPENKKLFEEIVISGCVVSEFSMETKPLAVYFPRRNRIISGLSLGVVVAEASRRSGALITSRFALEQGREVFAVPGKIDNPNTHGVHNLIKEGAVLINGADDILEELQPHLERYLKSMKSDSQRSKSASTILEEKDKASAPAADLPVPETNLYRYIVEDPLHIDEIAQQSGLSVSEAAAILLRLELKGFIRQSPGKFFVRVKHP